MTSEEIDAFGKNPPTGYWLSVTNQKAADNAIAHGCSSQMSCLSPTHFLTLRFLTGGSWPQGITLLLPHGYSGQSDDGYSQHITQASLGTQQGSVLLPRAPGTRISECHLPERQETRHYLSQLSVGACAL